MTRSIEVLGDRTQELVQVLQSFELATAQTSLELAHLSFPTTWFARAKLLTFDAMSLILT